MSGPLTRDVGLMKITITVMIACLVMGCVSTHKWHERTIVAHIAGVGEPAAGYPVKIEYPYDHYNCILLRYWNEPKPYMTNLNERGEARVRIASFFDPYLEVGSTRLRIKLETIENGGRIEPLPYQPNTNYPRVYVELIP